MAARSDSSVSGDSLGWMVGSNHAVGMDVCLLRMLCVVRSLIQISATECGMSDYDRGALVHITYYVTSRITPVFRE